MSHPGGPAPMTTTQPSPENVERSFASDDSCQMQLYLRGHFDDDAFLKCLRSYIKDTKRPDLKVSKGFVRRTYWRAVPVKNNIVCDHIFHESGKGPGAFPVTIHDNWLPIFRPKQETPA